MEWRSFMKTTIGKLLKTARNKKGLTAVEAATRAGINRMTYVRLEEQQVKAYDIKQIEKIANALDIDLCDILVSVSLKFDQIDIDMMMKCTRRISYQGKLIDPIKLGGLLANNINEIMVDADVQEF